MSRSKNSYPHPSDPAYDPPPPPEHFIEGKPRGFCPWCGAKLMEALPREQYEGRMFCTRKSILNPSGHVGCEHYEMCETEDENRIRYAAHALEDAEAGYP